MFKFPNKLPPSKMFMFPCKLLLQERLHSSSLHQVLIISQGLLGGGEGEGLSSGLALYRQSPCWCPNTSSQTQETFKVYADMQMQAYRYKQLSKSVPICKGKLTDTSNCQSQYWCANRITDTSNWQSLCWSANASSQIQAQSSMQSHGRGLCVCTRVCACACMRACVRACVCECSAKNWKAPQANWQPRCGSGSVRHCQECLLHATCSTSLLPNWLFLDVHRHDMKL